jgi:hypothetical protein
MLFVFKGLLPHFLSTAIMGLFLSSPAAAEERGASHSVAFFVGVGSDTNFTQTFYAPWTVNIVDLQFAGATVSTRLGTLSELVGDPDLGFFGDHLTLEPEVGIGSRFGDETMGEVWTALYFRYDGLPWNDTLYTTVALNLGLSVISETSEFEKDRSNGHSNQLLSYFSPEITIADPDNKDLELVFRVHHRSGAFGTFDGVWSGSSFLNIGLRMRF